MTQLPAQIVPFLGVVAVITAAPGPDTALVVRNVIAGRLEDGIATAVGCTVGLIVWGIAAALGISALFVLSTFSFVVLRFLGAGYLAYFGIHLLWRALGGSGALLANRSTSHPNPTPASSFRQGLFTDLLNPKAAAFFSALLPQYISPKTDSILSTTIVYACIAASSALVGLSAYAFLAAKAGALLSQRKCLRILDALIGSAFVAFAGRLALRRP